MAERSALNQFRKEQRDKAAQMRAGNVQAVRDFIGVGYVPESVAAAKERGDTREASPAWNRVAPVTQNVAQAAVPAPATAPAPAKTDYTPNPAFYREAPDYDYGKARETMTRAAINMLNGSSPLPQAYRSNVAVNAPDRAQMMAQNLQMERNNKQSDFYDRMRQVGFVTPDLLKEALADRRAARTLAAQSVGEAGRQAGQANQQAIDEARLMENASQAEYASQWKRPQLELDMAGRLLQGAGQAGQIQNQADRNAAWSRIANDENAQKGLQMLVDMFGPDEYGQIQDPDTYKYLGNLIMSMYGNPQGYAGGGMVDIHTYADGGEVEVEAPTEEGKLAGLDTGDYVFPVEAVRFYGTKTIKAMVEKAMMAADD